MIDRSHTICLLDINCLISFTISQISDKNVSTAPLTSGEKRRSSGKRRDSQVRDKQKRDVTDSLNVTGCKSLALG